MHRARYVGRDTEPSCSLWVPLSLHLQPFANLEALENSPFGYLWRLYYIYMID